jgi:hypothetical protein
MSKLGFQVKTLHQLMCLAIERRSVICPNARCFNKPTPAAFIINLQGRLILRLFKTGLYLYIKNK